MPAEGGGAASVLQSGGLARKIDCPSPGGVKTLYYKKEQRLIRVLIADDFPQMIDVMERLIAGASDMSAAGVMTHFQDVLERILEIEHEVVLMNDYLPPTTSVTATARLREMGVNAPILIISMYRDADLIRDSLDAGANGFILKEEFTQHLLPAIRAVFGGERYLSPIAISVLGDQA